MVCLAQQVLAVFLSEDFRCLSEKRCFSNSPDEMDARKINFSENSILKGMINQD